jgi:hypothetical protein
MSDLRSALLNIYTNRGELTPQIVVDEARPEGAPLHDRFEWNDKTAGEAYRRVQAGQLIRSVQIEYVPDERKYVRAFSSVRQTDTEKRGYQPTEEILSDPLRAKILLRECQRAIADLKLKYGHLAEFAELLRQAAA